MSTECIPIAGEVSNRVWCNCMGSFSSRTSINLTEYSDEVPDSSLGTTSPDHQAVSPKCLLNTTRYLCRKEENNILYWKQHFAFLFKVVEGSVPSIPPEDYLIPQRLKHAVRVRTFKDHVTSNILDCQVSNNSNVFGYLHRRANHMDTRVRTFLQPHVPVS